MKPRLFVPLVAAALVLAFGTVAVACGGGNGDGLTLEEYFQRLEALSTDYDQRGNALGEGFAEEFSSDEEQFKAAQEFWEDFIALFGEFVNDLDDLNPPSEVEAAHKESVDAGSEALKGFQEFVDQVRGAESLSELEERFGSLELETVGDRFDQACVTLQGIADANGIDVSLNCGED